jgi:hypothetical protein
MHRNAARWSVELQRLSVSGELGHYVASLRWGCDRNLIGSRSQILSSAIARLFGYEGRDRGMVLVLGRSRSNTLTFSGDLPKSEGCYGNFQYIKVLSAFR